MTPKFGREILFLGLKTSFLFLECRVHADCTPKEGERCECNGCDCHCFQEMSGTECPADAGISLLDQSKLFRILISNGF